MRTLRAAFALLQTVSLPAVRLHRGRALLTLAGVMIGAQAVVAVAVIHRSVLASFEETIEAIAGPADLQVANASAGVPEELAEAVARLPGVASAAALIQGNLETSLGTLTVFGIDLLADQAIRRAQFPREHVRIPDSLRFVNAVDSVALSTSFADRGGLGLGARLETAGPAGPATLAVRGLLDPVGPAALFDGAVGLVDLPTAQRLFAREGRVDQIDVALAPGADAEAVRRALEALVAGVGSVEPPRERGARLGSMLGAVQTVLTLVSLFAVVVGAFIAYHTLEAAVAQRRRELALARAVGYEPRAILLAVAAEALAYGLAGSLAGAALGLGAARLALGLVTEGIGAIWGRVEAAGLTLATGDILVALALGTGSALAAALVPARKAARVSVVDELRGEERVPAAASWRALVPAGLAAGAGYALLASGVRPEGFVAQVGLVMSGVVLLAVAFAQSAPLVVTALARVALALTARARAPSPRLAAEAVGRDPRASRGVIAALMVAFAMVLIVSAFVRSLRGSLLAWVEQTLTADLHVAPGLALPLPGGPTLPGTVEDLVRATPGVAEVSPSRMIHVRVGDGLAVLRTVSAGGLDRQRYPVVAGDLAAARPAFAAAEAVLVSDNLAYRHGLRAGDALRLATPSGERTFRIGAIVADYTLDIGTIIIERGAYETLWRDNLANEYLVWAAPGADPAALRAELARRLRATPRATVLSGREFRVEIVRALDRALLLTHAIQLVAIAIAAIGVVNFFLAAIVDRRREIGLLRSVAFTPRQVAETLAGEALLLGVAGGVLAVLYAWPVARLLVTHSTRMVSGWTLTFEFPVALAAATVGLAALASLAAAMWPVRRIAAAPAAALVAVE
jgi:putative ABC transport system permease protein